VDLGQLGRNVERNKLLEKESGIGSKKVARQRELGRRAREAQHLPGIRSRGDRPIQKTELEKNSPFKVEKGGKGKDATCGVGVKANFFGQGT